jgi:cell division inhibitor SepF
MVYLGLQDDEPDYNGDYESYPAYGDVDAGADTDGAADDYNERPRRDAGYDAEPEPARAAVGSERRATAPSRGRDDPASPPTPRPSVVRTIGPTTAARVHIVEPQSFNDAQEVGDRLKANQPVILNLQGLPKELQRRLIDFSSGLAYAVGARRRRSPPGVPAEAERRRGLPRGATGQARPLPGLSMSTIPV